MEITNSSTVDQATEAIRQEREQANRTFKPIEEGPIADLIEVLQAERERLQSENDALTAVLQEILKEAEFVGDAHEPFTTWVATKCRVALAEGKQQ